MMTFWDFVNKRCFNIWRYVKLYRRLVRSKYRLTLGEGWTKEANFKNLSKKFHLPCFYLKREDLNPLGSFKIRGLAYQVSLAFQNGERKFCISSTGNAALAAAALCKKADLELFIFLHKKPRSKTKRTNILKEIKSFQPQKIFFEKRPTEKCKEFSGKEKIYNLTPSLDRWSSEGFKSIGLEIFEKFLLIPNNNSRPEELSVFSFSSSGSSMIGIGESFKSLFKKGFLKKLPRLYSVKKGQIKRAREVENLLKENQGKILDVSQKDIKKAQYFLTSLNVKTSIEGICAFAGFLKTYKTEEIKRAIIILSGKKWSK